MRALCGVCLSIAFSLSSAGACFARPDPLSATPALLEAPGAIDTFEFFPGAVYDPSIPTADRLAGFRLGDRPATHAEVEKCLLAWGATEPGPGVPATGTARARTRLVKHGQTHEGRALYHLVISSPENISRLAEIKNGWARLADPRGLGDADAKQLLDTLPAVAWLAYCIHGDEPSGTDAALAAAYHLVASTDGPTAQLLENVVIVIDPLMNPDGRDRYLRMLNESRGARPSFDDTSTRHEPTWPSGRMNHYLFDLNRDWIFATQPESRGRLGALREWHPLLFVDSHEMGAQDTFLFSPSREPVNPNIPASRKRWWRVFADDQARAFDAFGWRYYTGEWNEEWYPGYSSSWAGYRGAVGILYEQANVGADAVRLASGELSTYRDSVHHQLVSTLANIGTLYRNRQELAREFLEERRLAVSDQTAKADTMVAIALPSGGFDDPRAAHLKELLRLQGIEAYLLNGMQQISGIDRAGRAVSNLDLPGMVVLIPFRQPEAPLTRALFEFDIPMTAEVLQDERRELLRRGQSRIYDVTAWSLPMLLDLPAYQIKGAVPAGAGRLDQVMIKKQAGGVTGWETSIGFAIDGAGDNAVAVAARLMEAGMRVRAAQRPFVLSGQSWPRGTLVVLSADNPAGGAGDAEVRATLEASRAAMEMLKEVPAAVPSWARAVHLVCAEGGVIAHPLKKGLGEGEGDPPDLGGEHFSLLERPRIAILTRGSTSPYSAGQAWYFIDHVLRVRASLISTDTGLGADLRRYNVLVVPDAWGSALPEGERERIGDWVRQGGTLIAVGSSAAALAGESGIGSVKRLGDVLGDLSPYAMQVLREHLARSAAPEPAKVFVGAAPESFDFPWADALTDGSDEKELARRDDWASLFMPQGAIVAARTDDEHWLTFGVGNELPVLVSDMPILMTDGSASAPVRLGVFEARAPEAAPAPASTAGTSTADKPAEGKDADDKPKAAFTGWAPLPPATSMRLRMGGLLWPEAAWRLASAPYVTQERIGRGQVILFAGEPNFRAATRGTARLFMNAVVFGPGCGASAPIVP